MGSNKIQVLIDIMSLKPELFESVTKLPNGRYKVTCPFQQCNVVNKNKRRYPLDVWQPHLLEDSEFMIKIRNRQVFGRLEHPIDGNGGLPEAAIVITDLWLRENDGVIMGTFETLSTHAGKDAAAFFDDGCSVALSSRARGSTRYVDGVNEVLKEDFLPETFDLVSDQSVPIARINVNESCSRTEAEIVSEDSFARLYEQANVLMDDVKTGYLVESWSKRLTEIEMLNTSIRGKDKDMSESVIKNIKRNMKNKNSFSMQKKKEILNKLNENAIKAAEIFERISDKVSLLEETEEIIDMKNSAEIAADSAVSAVDIANFPTADMDKINKAAEVSDKAVSDIEDIETDVDIEGEIQKVAVEDETDSELENEELENEIENEEEIEQVEDIDSEDVAIANIDNVQELSSLEFSFDFSSFSDSVKKKINIFRAGEYSEDLVVLVQSACRACDADCKTVDISWLENKLIIKIEVNSSLVDKVKLEVNKIFILEPTPVVNSVSEDYIALIDENKKLILENKNLRILNTEMAKMFEEEIVKHKLNSIYNENPELKEYDFFLKKERTRKGLNETLQQIQKFKSETVNKSKEEGSNFINDMSKLYEDIQSSSLKAKQLIEDSDIKEEKEDDIFSRVSRYMN